MFGLSFLVPAFLLGALAATVPIVLHLLRRDHRPRQPFSAVRFLRGVPVEQARRRRLRELLLLVLRVSAFILLAAAFARPVVDDTAGSGPAATIVLIDTSFSMSGPGQAARARRFALDAIASAPEGHLVGVMAFDEAPRVIAAPGSRSAARAAVETAAPGARATRYGQALTAASEEIGARTGRIVVVTDLQAAGWEAGGGAVSSAIEVEVRDVGAPVGNLAVVGLEPEADSTAAVLYRAGDTSGEVTLSLAVDGVQLSEVSVIPRPGRTTVRFPVTLPAAGVATASVHDEVGYAADDRWFRLLDPPDPVPVLIIGDDPRTDDSVFFLQRALAPGEASAAFALDTVRAEALAARQERLAGVGAVVLAGAGGLGREGRDHLAAFVRDGGGLLLAGGAGTAPAQVVGLFEGGPRFGAAVTHDAPVSFVPSNLRHPIMRGLGSLSGMLSRARFSRTLALDPGDAAVLARFDDGTPALVEHRAGAGRVMIFASGLGTAWSDLPRHAVFVPFLHEMVGYLAASPAATREFTSGDGPAGADGPGVATLADRGGRYVVNVDAREADPAAVTMENFDAEIERLSPSAAGNAPEDAGTREAGQRHWRDLLMLMALVLAIEGVLGRQMA